MGALGDLGELERVPEEDDVARGRAHGERIGQRHLARLVDHQRVDHPRPESLAHHRVEVHEDLPPQQIVHRVLAARVDAHQLRDRRLLVGAVVVHVHAGIPGEALVDEVHEPLEQPALLDPVVGPHRLVAPVRAVAEDEAEQEMEAPRRLPERIALDVEDHVSDRQPRQQGKPAARVARDGMPVEVARAPPSELERRLIAKRLQGKVGHPLHARLRRRRREGGERRQAGAAQELHLRAADVRHEREMVLRLPAGRAHSAELAERAVVDRVRLGDPGRGDDRLEPGAHAPVVRREVVVAQ
jgi:hypothetical protein